MALDTPSIPGISTGGGSLGNKNDFGSDQIRGGPVSAGVRLNTVSSGGGISTWAIAAVAVVGLWLFLRRK